MEHTGQAPREAGRPFFIVIACGLLISLLDALILVTPHSLRPRVTMSRQPPRCSTSQRWVTGAPSSGGN